MIPLLTREAVRALDERAIEDLGVPGLLLMENAGRGAADLLVELHGDRLQRVVVVGGPGQNGGDAWVLARRLRVLGHRPRCWLVGDEAKVGGDARVNLDALRGLGLPVHPLEKLSVIELREELAGASVVVDGLFGTGLSRRLTGSFLDAVQAMNASPAPVFSLDLPSGVDASTGAVLGAAPRAHCTATFAAHKLGLHQYPGAGLAGEVRCVDIGVPGPTESQASLFELEDVAEALPVRPLDAHKGSAGHVLAVAGAPGKTGAAQLAAEGALRAGAGLVTVAARADALRALEARCVEVMSAPLPEGGAQGLAEVLRLASPMAAMLVGPGLGLDEGARSLARSLAVEVSVPTVLDADALTAIGVDLDMLRQAQGPRVLTPHPGEAGRLLGCPSAEVQADRYGAARELASRAGHPVVLKGARTVVAASSGLLRVNRRGTPALAVAGTGDVLAGVIAALLATVEPLDAASVGVCLHAVAGERAARGDRGLLAREVASAIPGVLHECHGSAGGTATG